MTPTTNILISSLLQWLIRSITVTVQRSGRPTIYASWMVATEGTMVITRHSFASHKTGARLFIRFKEPIVTGHILHKSSKGSRSRMCRSGSIALFVRYTSGTYLAHKGVFQINPQPAFLAQCGAVSVGFIAVVCPSCSQR